MKAFREEFYHFSKSFFFWLCLFNIQRIVFLISYSDRIKGIPFSDLFKIPVKAFALDLSFFCYLSAIPVLLFTVQKIVNKAIPKKVFYFYYLLVALFSVLAAAGEWQLYQEWETKIDYRAVVTLGNPSEVFLTATTAQTFWFVFYLIVFMTGISIVFRRYILNSIFIAQYLSVTKRVLSSLLFLIVSAAFIGIGLRGGLQQIPINQSWCYFSKSNLINLTTINTPWNLIASLSINARTMSNNPYVKMRQDLAEKTVNELLKVNPDSTSFFLKSNKPNIVIFILESFSADLISTFGGDSGIAVNLERMSNEGLKFDQIYSSGLLSHQGMASIFGGIPSQPAVDILKEPSKYKNLPCLVKPLKKQGYFSSFYFGGELGYANIKSYIFYNDFDIIKDMDDFDSNLPRGKLGIHDGFIFQEHFKELEKHKTPFISCIFTTSTHSPYDIPVKWKIKKGGSERDFLNGAWYSDSCINAHIQKCKKFDWFTNTLFVFVADHSKHSHIEHNYFDPEYRHIPLFFWGEVIKPEFKGKTIHSLGNHFDLPVTILNQLNLPHSEFKWSRDLMNTTRVPYAYYSGPDMLGWKNESGYHVYSFQNKGWHVKNCTDPKDSVRSQNQSFAFLQALFQEYLSF